MWSKWCHYSAVVKTLPLVGHDLEFNSSSAGVEVGYNITFHQKALFCKSHGINLSLVCEVLTV